LQRHLLQVKNLDYMRIVKKLKSKLNTPFSRLIKDSIRDRKNIDFYKKRYLIQKSIGRKKSISYIPPNFTIYITFRCNFRCPACLYLLKDSHAFDKGGDMRLESFNWILDKFKERVRVVALGGGEPTLHPQFSKIVRSVKNRNLRLEMATNGTLIKKRIKDLKYFDKINISLDGVDYKSFKKIRNGTEDQYNTIIEGIYLLKDSGIPFNLSLLLFEETLSEINKILEFTKKIKPRILNLHSGNPHGSKKWTPLTIKSPKVKDFLKAILKNSDYSFSIRLPIIFNPDSRLFYKQSCPLLWENVYIGWNGDIAYCCHSMTNSKIGNIFKGYDFNSPLMVNFRKAMIKHKFSEDCLYCHRRFSNSFSGFFDSEKKKWIVPFIYQKFLPKN